MLLELLLQGAILFLSGVHHRLQGAHTCLKRANRDAYSGWRLFPESLW